MIYYAFIPGDVGFVHCTLLILDILIKAKNHHQLIGQKEEIFSICNPMDIVLNCNKKIIADLANL
jgi:hypothetical protein